MSAGHPRAALPAIGATESKISSAPYANLRAWLPVFATRSADEIISAVTTPAS